uniref:C2 domain-containing protein n=1 Tax=Odontella aurita TaxID=265563 RepID=A0A7S4MIM5_9STRA|mmetsp:Transcript_23022/g.67926  ORF Transcript_23022/g.67926 Transcript_23022/m.67926 type:complete len:543 (+) Transcript_23022:538-2166(+)
MYLHSGPFLFFLSFLCLCIIIIISRQMLVLDWDGDEDATTSVAVRSESGDEDIGRAQFNIASILNGRSNVMYEDIAADDGGGGTIFIHATENILDESALKFQIHGKALSNLGKGFFGQKSDPFYEVRNTSGDCVYKSEVKRDNLNPDWSMAQVGLLPLCGGDLDAPVTFSVFDEDRGDKRKSMGSFAASVNDLVVAATRGELLSIGNDDDDGKGAAAGHASVLRAEYVGGVVAPPAAEILAAAAEAKGLMEAHSIVAASKTCAADVAREEFEKAQQEAMARKKSERMAKDNLAEAREAERSAKTESVNAAQEAERLKKAGLMGTLNFQFVGERLENVETLKFMGDKSDPFFVLQKVESERDGKTQWSHVFISNVIKNKLNPIWEEAKVEIGDICKGNLDERIRVVVFDWSRTKKHNLIGSFETSVNGIISAQKSASRFSLTRNKKVTGRVFVPFAEIIDLVNPEIAEEKAKDLAKKADMAHYYAYGAECRVKLAVRNAEEAHNVALQSEQTVEATTQEADAAWRMTLERSVSITLSALGLGS